MNRQLGQMREKSQKKVGKKFGGRGRKVVLLHSLSGLKNLGQRKSSLKRLHKKQRKEVQERDAEF